jgi:hypothetical protein
LPNEKKPEERKEWWEKNKPLIFRIAATDPLGKDEPEIRRIIMENGQVKWMIPTKIADLKKSGFYPKKTRSTCWQASMDYY